MERKIEGELQPCTQYDHRLSGVTLVSASFPVFLGIRFQKVGETKVACSLALLEELCERLGRRFLDVLVADALYLETPTPFVRAIEALGLQWVINLRDNQPELLRESQRLSEREADEQERREREQLRLWHLPAVDWPRRRPLGARGQNLSCASRQWRLDSTPSGSMICGTLSVTRLSKAKTSTTSNAGWGALVDSSHR